VALDGAGIALASDNATASLPAWSASGAGGHPSGISCLPTGLCAAVEAGGHELAARVPPPAVATTLPTEVSASTARLAGVVNPNDALLSSCYFEYGPQASYGQIAPCSSLPSPAGGAQEVSAQLVGLTPNATYHYRLIASSASGVQAGADQAFTTAVSSEVALMMAHPSIGGTPAVGQRLTCRTGLPSSSTARVSFAWLRDLLPIAGATSSTYVVKGTDGGHHLQCQVTATTAGGSTTAKSAFVTIPAQGVLASVGETAIGRARVRGTSVSVVVVCSVHATKGCHVVLRLTVTVHRRRVTIGATAARLARGQHRVLTLKLNSRGRHLLAHARRLPAVLAARGTVIGVIEALLSQQRVTLGARSHGAPSHAHHG